MKGVTSIERKGTTYWYASIDGQKKYCGKDAEGKELAEAARSKHLAKKYEIRQAGAGIEVKRAAFNKIRDMCNWYMELSTTQKKKSYLRETQALKHLLPYFGKIPVGKLKGSDTVKYRDKRTKQKANDNTVDYELAVLRQIYRLAIKLDEIPPDSIPGQFVMNGEVNPRPIITNEQFELLHKNTTPKKKHILLCAWESAMRSGEISNLRAKNVHLDAFTDMDGEWVSYISLGVFDTKTGAERTVPVSDTLKEMLIRRLEGLQPNERVFLREDGKPFNANSISDRMRTLCKQLDIPYADKLLDEEGYRVGIVFHCLRHTRTSKWVEMGFSDEIVRKATGHKSLEAYRRYVKLNPSSVMRLVKSQKRIISDNFTNVNAIYP